jgi:hypothetical protein
MVPAEGRNFLRLDDIAQIIREPIGVEFSLYRWVNLVCTLTLYSEELSTGGSGSSSPTSKVLCVTGRNSPSVVRRGKSTGDDPGDLLSRSGTRLVMFGSGKREPNIGGICGIRGTNCGVLPGPPVPGMPGIPPVPGMPGSLGNLGSDNRLKFNCLVRALGSCSMLSSNRTSSVGRFSIRRFERSIFAIGDVQVG